LLVIIIVVPILIYFIFKSKAVKPMMLETNIDGKVKNVEDDTIHIGDEGVTIGRLAPSGKAKINGITLEVRTTGTFVDPHTKIKVIKVEGNTVIIDTINE
jgi:membrane-bound ClpP family serine protease